MTELPDHLPQHRETDAHDVVVVPLDATHEGATEPVDGEGAGDVQRLAAADVRRDLLAPDLVRDPDDRCQPHRGVGQLLDTVHDVRRFTNRGLEVWGVLPTLYDGRTNHARTVLDTISQTYDLEVLEPPIPKTIKFAEAPAAGRSILATSRTSKGAQAYREVAANLVTRAGRKKR
mgnify:CR=1 FL=1